ncbi:hypothetical protein V6N11_051879 [Hibiscus sabdariffa]|uniref:Uncharacterized protein n=1 Tax=Hibiscus sabdariffa TaxID=183260 RepID=A0ABR2U8G8_9ROSI
MKDESGNVNVRDGDVNTVGFVCTCAGHGGVERQGQAQTGMAGSGQIQGQWYIDSGATHHVTPEAAKVVQGTEYAGASKIIVDAKCGVVPSTHETSGRSSNELLVIPELDKLRGIFASNKNATGEQMYQEGGEEMADVHEEESDSSHGVDEELQEETRVGGGIPYNCNAGGPDSHEDMHDEALAGGSGGSRMEDELCDGCVEGLENGSGSDQSADRNLHSEYEGMQTIVENGVNLCNPNLNNNIDEFDAAIWFTSGYTSNRDIAKFTESVFVRATILPKTISKPSNTNMILGLKEVSSP